MADAPETTDKQPDHPPVAPPTRTPLDDRDLIHQFESLGGAGHGDEFGQFQTHVGVETLGLLGWADLATDLLIRALEQRFEGVGEPETTIIFQPDGHKEWWTRDTRFWMAMRTLLKAASTSPNDVAPAILERLRSLRARLLVDLTEGRKLFVFRDLAHDLDAARLERLHAAIRAYGPGCLFYLRYEDADHPAGRVEAVKPGLLIGYVTNFTFSRQNQFIGSINNVMLELCRRAWALHTASPVQEEPGARPSSEPPVAPPPQPVHRTEPASRRIVFVGNRQVEVMANLYRRYIVPRTQDHVEIVPGYDDLSSEHHAILEQSDLIVEQVMDLTPATGTNAVAPGTPRIHLPFVTGAFLWPFRAQAHPKAVSYPFMPTGAFDHETSDSYLNRLIVAGADPEQAVEEYANLDVAKVANLDRLYGLMIDRQRTRDAATGYDIAAIIERHFRTEYIFLSPFRPNTRVTLALAEDLFRRLGATNDDIDRMRARTRVSPFAGGETPIHLGVCRHWGLNYIAPDQRYRFRNEGTFTFREYALRYMRYEWNNALEEGVWLSHQRRYAEAVAPLRTALTITPRSASGWNALGEALCGLAQNDATLVELRRAVDIEPENAGYHAALGNALRDAGHFAEAEAAMRQAMKADPTEPQYAILLAHLARHQNKFAEAAQAFETALALDPWTGRTWQELPDVQEAEADWAGAQQALRRAIEIDGTDTELQGRHGSHDDTVDTAHRPVEPQPQPAESRAVPTSPPQHQGPTQATLQEGFKAAAMAPDDAEAYHSLGCLLREAGDAVAAEQAFHRALALRPGVAHYHHEVSVLYLQNGRHPEALKAAEEAVALEPVNLQRYLYLANVLGSGRAFDQARERVRLALTLAPDYLPFHIAISDLFAHEDRLDEALAAARAITRNFPDNPQALGHLAHIEQLLGHLQDAEVHLHSALALAPENGHLRHQLDRLKQRPAA